MDNIYLKEEHTILREQVRRFVDEEVAPNAEAWDAAGDIPRAPFKKLGELGLLGLRHPEEYGGSDLDALASVTVAEALGHSTSGGFSARVTVHTDMASPHLARYGTDEQKTKYLTPIIAGESLCAVAVTEPDAGSDVAAVKTTAKRHGNDAWVINGAKMFITNGAAAEGLFVAARPDPDAKGSQGLSMFIVEKGTPGFSCAKRLDKMGWRASDTAELVFEDCVIPAENLLGTENRGFYQIMDNFQNERMVIGAVATGEATKAIELTLDYVKTRKAFGGVLWDREAIQQRLAMLAAKVEAGRQLWYHAAWLDSLGRDCVKEVSMVKAFCAETAQQVMYDCLQFHGGMGYMRETPIERMTRDARILTIGGGATEVMLREIAKRM